MWSAVAGQPLTYQGARPMATKGDPVRSRACTAAWEASPAMRRIHVRLSLLIGLLMVAYAALRLVVVFAASSISEAVWAQEVPGLVLLVAVLALIRSQVPRLSRIVDAEQAALQAPAPAA